MSSLYIEEYVTSAIGARGPVQCAQQPPIATQKLDYTAGVAQSAAFNAQTLFVRISADTPCSFAFGINPTATVASAQLNADESEYFGVIPGHKVSVIANGVSATPASTTVVVTTFGATGDGTTDDHAAIQAAIDSLPPGRGGKVFFPRGSYRISTGLTVVHQGTELCGEGNPGFSRDNGAGSSRIISDNGIDAITCYSGSHGTIGYVLRSLHIHAATGATTGNGVIVKDTENGIIEDVTCSDYIGGIGLKIDGLSGNAQYWTLRNFSAGDCLTGFKQTGAAPNGTRMFGGYFAGAGTTPRVGSKGIWVDTGDTFREYGVVVQGYETGRYYNSPASGANELHGPRSEFCNINYRFGASEKQCTMYGGSCDNNLLVNTGAGNIGIQIDAGATDISISPTQCVAGLVANAIIDNGTRTRYPTSVALPGTSNYVTGNVTMTTANTFYDGPSITLPPGTWLLIGKVNLVASTVATRQWTAKLLSGSGFLACLAVKTIYGTAIAAQDDMVVSAIVTPTASQTFKISATSSVNGDILNATSGNVGSFLIAIPVAGNVAIG